MIEKDRLTESWFVLKIKGTADTAKENSEYRPLFPRMHKNAISHALWSLVLKLSGLLTEYKIYTIRS